MNRPVVGITAWRRTLDTLLGAEILQTLATYYSEATITAGMTPIIFPNGQDPSTAASLIERVDGLIISGGDDVDPATYGKTASDAKGQSSAVDEFEIALLSEARLHNKPVLAICRGIQLLNVALGGTLSQEITKAGTVHDLITADADPEELNERRHVVELESGSVLAGLYGTQELKVNTLHHQGIADLSPQLLVEGRTEDGLIEAVRCDGDWWALGVQWHPERMDLSHQNPLFGAFRDSIVRADPVRPERRRPSPVSL